MEGCGRLREGVDGYGRKLKCVGVRGQLWNGVERCSPVWKVCGSHASAAMLLARIHLRCLQADAVSRLSERVDVEEITHVIGADLASAPVFEGAEMGAARIDRSGLEATIASLLQAQPRLKVRLLLVDRCVGGAQAALAGAAGVDRPHHGSEFRSFSDPAILRFEERCSRLGLHAKRISIPEHVVAHVRASQPLHERAYWWLSSTWEGLVLYSVETKEEVK